MSAVLTQQELKQNLNYSEETGVFIWGINKVGGPKQGREAGTVTANNYISICVLRKRYYAHRLAWLYVYGEFPENQIDHINHNRSDNRIKNLRCVTHAENAMNMARRKTSKSGCAGVTWDKANKKWEVKLKKGELNLFIGRFAKLANAIRARKNANKTHGFHPNHGK